MTAELDAVPFHVVRRGYDRAQVEERLGGLAAELDAAVAARHSAVDDLRTLSRQLEASRNDAQAARDATGEARAELDQLRIQVAELSTIPSTVDGMSERLQQMVRIAQDEVNDMRTRATTSAAHVLALAQAEADELRERSETERREFEAERHDAEESLRSQLEESRARLEQLRNDSDGQKARLDAELADRRARVEAEFGSEMDGRRSALLEDLGALEARQRQEAGRIVDMAAKEARTRVADATAEVQRVRAEAREDVSAAHRELEELRSLQHQVAEQLTSVRALLDWTLPQLGSATGRPAGPPDGPPPQDVAPPDDTPTEVVPAQSAAPQGGEPAGPDEPPTVGVPLARSGEVAENGRPTPAARHARIAGARG